MIAPIAHARKSVIPISDNYTSPARRGGNCRFSDLIQSNGFDKFFLAKSCQLREIHRDPIDAADSNFIRENKRI